MDKRIQQAQDWLQREMEKDKKDLEIQRKQMIEEVKKIKKEDLLQPKQKKKISVISKILMILGYGKKR